MNIEQLNTMKESYELKAKCGASMNNEIGDKMEVEAQRVIKKIESVISAYENADREMMELSKVL